MFRLLEILVAKIIVLLVLCHFSLFLVLVSSCSVHPAKCVEDYNY